MSRARATRGQQWALVVRLVGVALLLALLSLVIGGTAVVLTGMLVWVLLLVFAFFLGVFFPFGESFGLLTSLFANPVVAILVSGLVAAPVLYLPRVRRDILAFRDELGAAGEPANERYAELVEIAGRLAQQADIQPPSVYVVDRKRPESYAVGGRSNGTVVLTSGLVNRLSTEEVTAVLAHEISHLVNGDSRLMGVALAPMLFAEHLGREEPPALKWVVRAPLAYLFSLAAWAVVSVVTRVLRAGSQLAVALLSQERELAADRGAAELTGSPANLASALRTLDGTRTRPVDDKRTWTQSASALDILPREDAVTGDGPFRTHPPTEARIERLEAMAAQAQSTSP